MQQLSPVQLDVNHRNPYVWGTPLTPKKTMFWKQQDHPDHLVPSFHLRPYCSLLNNNICSSALKSSRIGNRGQCSLWVGLAETDYFHRETQRQKPVSTRRGKTLKSHRHTEKHTQHTFYLSGNGCLAPAFLFAFFLRHSFHISLFLKILFCFLFCRTQRGLFIISVSS